MKKLLVCFLLSFGSVLTMAQGNSAAKDSLAATPEGNTVYKTITAAKPDTSYQKLPGAKVNVPLYIINSRIISNLNFLNPNDIESITIQKDTAKLQANLVNLNKYGIVFIGLKKGAQIKTRTFRDIKDSLKVKGNVKFAVDGFFVKDESLLIAATSVISADVIRSKPVDKQTGTVINIWTMTFENRNGYIPLRRSTDKPGVIYIR